MDLVWHTSIIAIGIVLLVNMLLLIRVLRWLHDTQNLRNHLLRREVSPPLEVGTMAPPFRARTLGGELVTLDSFVGRSVVLVFVSPHCGGCRRKLAELQNPSVVAAQRAQVEMVLVSDSGTAETHEWINLVRDEDKVEIKMPVLTAPLTHSDFTSVYNPQGYLPYYCVIDDLGVIQARDPLGMGEWKRLEREWKSRAHQNLFSRSGHSS